MPETNENYPKRIESFEVVMIRKGKHPGNCAQDDYKRVPVSAENPLQAMMSDEVTREKDFVAQSAVPPGMMTDGEINARRRAMDAPTCRVCLSAPCVCK